jgi:hypothetical protein
LIDCLTFSELYFSHIQDENKFAKKKSERGPLDGSTWATTFDCYVGVRIGTIPALIVEGDYQGHPLESRGIKI